MSKVRSSILTKFVVVTTLILFMIAQHPGPLSSAEGVTVAVKHKPLKHFISGHRIQIEAEVTDTRGVSLVRCYFRAAGQADYVFVGMKAGEKDMFTGILPSAATETKAIEYLFLIVNGKNQVAKTQVFRTENTGTKDIPAWQSASSTGAVVVSTELAQATAPTGFNDSITADIVESSARFGMVAGIYSTTQLAAGGGSAAGGGTTAAGSTTGAAAAATSVGTVAASTGLSMLMIAGVSAAAVAVGAGVAVATSGGDDGAGGSEGSSSCQYVGTWTMTGRSDFTVGSDCVVDLGGAFTAPIIGNSFVITVHPFGNCTDKVEGTFTSSTTANGTWSSNCDGAPWSFTWTATKK